MNSEKVKEELEKIYFDILEIDIKRGETLLKVCKISEQQNNCVPSHKVEVINYMNEMENKYGFFNLLYNTVNNLRSNTNHANVLDKCYNLEKQIWVLKQVKDAKEDSDDLNKIFNALKEGIHE